MRLRRFNATTEYIPGKHLVVADALSRSRLSDTVSVEEILEVEQFVNSALESKPMSDAKIEALRQATSDDVEIQTAMQLTRSRWPDHVRDVPTAAKPYHQVRGVLSVASDLPIFRNCIVVPKSMRAELSDSVHAGDQGVTKFTERGRTSFSIDIKDKVRQCEFCITNKPTQRREPLLTTQLPDLPWQKIAADQCHVKGQNYFVVTDY